MSAGPSAKKAKGQQLTVEQRLQVFQLREQHMSQEKIAAQFGVTQAAISKILKMDRNKLRHAAAANRARHRIRQTQYSEVNDAVLDFIKARTRATDGRPRALSWILIQRHATDKAKELLAAGNTKYEGFTASRNWIWRLMKRNKVVRRALCGESAV
jgi:predicted transcriptional regulator